jgi:hypothetical protein
MADHVSAIGFADSTDSPGDDLAKEIGNVYQCHGSRDRLAGGDVIGGTETAIDFGRKNL